MSDLWRWKFLQQNIIPKIRLVTSKGPWKEFEIRRKQVKENENKGNPDVDKKGKKVNTYAKPIGARDIHK